MLSMAYWYPGFSLLLVCICTFVNIFLTMLRPGSAISCRAWFDGTVSCHVQARPLSATCNMHLRFTLSLIFNLKYFLRAAPMHYFLNVHFFFYCYAVPKSVQGFLYLQSFHCLQCNVMQSFITIIVLILVLVCMHVCQHM